MGARRYQRHAPQNKLHSLRVECNRAISVAADYESCAGGAVGAIGINGVVIMETVLHVHKATKAETLTGLHVTSPGAWVMLKIGESEITIHHYDATTLARLFLDAAENLTTIAEKANRIAAVS